MYVENTGARNEAGIKLKSSYCALPIADGSVKKNSLLWDAAETPL